MTARVPEVRDLSRNGRAQTALHGEVPGVERRGPVVEPGACQGLTIRKPEPAGVWNHYWRRFGRPLRQRECKRVERRRGHRLSAKDRPECVPAGAVDKALPIAETKDRFRRNRIGQTEARAEIPVVRLN